VPDTAEDLEVLDALTVIRRRPEMYVGGGTLPPTLAGDLVHDIAMLGALPAHVTKHEEWWLVSAETDWLCSASGEISIEPFFRIVRCPQWGGNQNEIRSEVALTALAEAVVTSACGCLTWIVGNATADTLPAEFHALMKSSITGRHVAFRMAPGGGTSHS
jgi:hypothetical protein